MKTLLSIVTVVAICIPTVVFAGPPAETGKGLYTAYLAGGVNKKPDTHVTGNGKVVWPGVGQWTAESAQQNKTASAPK